MEETLKVILNKLEKLDVIEKELKELKEGQEIINNRLGKIENKIENRFNQLANEIQYLYEGMDKRISIVEAKV